MIDQSLRSETKSLAAFAHNVYSQHGEDGIIERIFDIIGTTTRLCVEFGAWDGFYLSNTAHLWTKGWRGVLIEADPQRYADLVRNIKCYDCRAIRAFVGLDGADALEAILEREGINEEIDLLSIDIDGDDYHVFASLKKIRPRVIVCEYNPTIPPHLTIVQEPGQYFGCSALSLVMLAEAKGYCPVAMTDTNCIFVRREDFHLFANYETSFSALTAGQRLVYLITGYGGDYFLSEKPIYGCSGPSFQKVRGEYYKVSLEAQIGFIAFGVLRHPFGVTKRIGLIVTSKLLKLIGLNIL